MKLTIELVPQTSWYSNVRSHVSKPEWDQIRKKCYAAANHRCEICGASGKSQGRKHDVECHEIWHYDDSNHRQILTGFIALCPRCHEVKHAGRTAAVLGIDRVITQLCKVNFITQDQAADYIVKSMAVWQRRSRHKWTVDVKYIQTYMGNTQFAMFDAQTAKKVTEEGTRITKSLEKVLEDLSVYSDIAH